MVNDNETTSTQPELNMVTETTPTTEAPAEAPIEAPAEETSTEGTEAVADTAVSTTETSTKEPDLGTYPASTEKPVNSLEKQMEEQQTRIAQLEGERKTEQVRLQAEQYRDQLTQQGYTSEQSQSMATQYYHQQNQTIQQEQKFSQEKEFIEGQYKASLHYGKQYNVDPEQLIKFKDPQEMEVAARHQAELRSLKEENAKLKKQQVPAQSYDNSTAPAEASSSEARLLDQYNAGVRNPDTNSAARRAAGIG
jgi:hypothetical protein|tara:strand:+ start:165 stop:917 length:753 start_codon:yes stop_codon:yes gene_type:complete